MEKGGCFFCKKVDLSPTQGALCTVSVFLYFTFYLLRGVCTQRNGPEDYPCAPRDGDAASPQITLATQAHSCAAVKCGFFAAELLTLGVVLDHNMYIYIIIYIV